MVQEIKPSHEEIPKSDIAEIYLGHLDDFFEFVAKKRSYRIYEKGLKHEMEIVFRRRLTHADHGRDLTQVQQITVTKCELFEKIIEFIILFDFSENIFIEPKAEYIR